MEWTEVATDPVTNEVIIVCELTCPDDELVQDFYDFVNSNYADAERHWRKRSVLLVKRKPKAPAKLKPGRIR